MKKSVFSIVLFLCSLVTVSYSQCDTGSEPECTCETAEVLCSVAELDGFSSTMGSFLHPGDGPSPFCGGGTQTNNPTWFAFIAWCSDITLEVAFENCTTVNNFEGAQLAVYTDCTFSEQLDCDSQCNDDSTASIDLAGLTIGESYYVMLDGCFGSACDYELSVSPTDCDEFIEDWDDPVTEDEVICVAQSIIYTVDNLSGATNWHWYLDGEEIDVTDIPSYEIAWEDEGEYELCVDVSNICLDVDEDPEINCVMITVANPDAGDLSANDSPECPNEFIEIAVEEYNNADIYTELLIFVNSEGEVVLVLNGVSNYNFTWPTCDIFRIYSLNFVTVEDIEVPDVGDDYMGSDCMLFCCDETFIDVVFEDEDAPEFDKPPEDITIDCYLSLYDLEIDEVDFLDVEDNCIEDTEVLGAEVVQADTCQGGTIVREWFFMDDCGLEVFHQQTITILPWAAPQFLNPPSDTTMSNLEYQSYVISPLEYTNGLTRDCKISGTLNPLIEDNRNGCAGFVLVTYATIDPCGRELIATQQINIIPDVMARDTSIIFCDINQTGNVVIDQTDLDTVVASDLTNVTVNYYPTTADLAAGANEITFPVNSENLPEAFIYATVTDAGGCYSELNIEIKIQAVPSLDLMSMAETCLGSADGSIEISVPINLSTYTLLQDNDTININTISDLIPGNYKFLLIDSLGCSVLDSIEVGTGFEINFENVFSDCNNNGTGTNSTDDFYEVEFVLVGGSGQFSLDVGSVINQGTYNYDETISIQVPADGNVITLTATDVIFNCTTSFDLGNLEQCSTDCELSLDQLDSVCNDNGTPLDPLDDYFEYTVNVSAINSGSSNMYNIYVDNVLTFSFDYDVVSNFNLDATNASVTLGFEDLDQNDCSLNLDTDLLIPCSNLCQLDISIESVDCIDPGTPSNNNDDLFEVGIIVSGINASSSFTVEQTGGVFNYNELIVLDNNLILNGDLVVEIFDSNDISCVAEVTIPAPAPCSTPCDLELLDLAILDCDDNGTGMVDTDDFFSIEFTVGSILGSGSDFILIDDNGNEFGPFVYGNTNFLGPFIADGSEIVLSLSDAFNTSCILELSISQEGCSTCNHSLELNADILTIDCENTTSNLDAQGDEAIVEYLWEGPDNFISSLAEIGVGVSGEYTLQAIFQDGCVLNESITIVSSTDVPISNAGDDLLLNCKTATVTLDGTQSEYGNNVIINWLDESGNIISEDIQFEVSEPGLYGLQLIDAVNNCISEIDMVLVEENVDIPVAIIYADPGNILDCIILNVNLSYEVEPNTDYNWIVNNQIVSTQNELILSEPQTVGLIAVNIISECQSESSLMILDETTYPQISILDVEKLDCTTGESCVTANNSSNNDIQYSWYDTNGTLISNDEITYCFGTSGEYTVELVDLVNGCTNTESFVIEGPTLPSIDLREQITLINDETGELSAELNIDENLLASILWEGEASLSCYNCLNPTILSAQDSTVLSLTITTLEGCVDVAEVLIRVKRIPNIYIPNVINPGEREDFTVFSSSDINTIEKLAIYDRWGNLVFVNESFSPNDSDLGWDGTRDGNSLEQGVYVYHVQYKVDGQIENVFGTVTLLK